jgi:hypothetical protein
MANCPTAANQHQERQKPAFQGVWSGKTIRPNERGRGGWQSEYHRERCHDELPNAVLRPLGSEQRHGGADCDRRDRQPYRRECWFRKAARESQRHLQREEEACRESPTASRHTR